MFIHRFAWPFAIRQTWARFTDFPHSVDPHIWTNQIAESGTLCSPRPRDRPAHILPMFCVL